MTQRLPRIAILPFRSGFASRARRAAAGQGGALDPGLAVFAVWVIAMLASYNVLSGAAPVLRRGRRGPPRLRRAHVHVDPGGRRSVSRWVLRRPADRLPPDRRHHDRPAGPHLLDRVHGPRPRVLALLRVPQPVHVLDAPARPRGQLAGRVRRLGAGRAVQLPAHRVLVPQELGRPRREEGVPRQPRRRRRLRARDHGDLRDHPRARRAHAQHSRVHRAPDRAPPS